MSQGCRVVHVVSGPVSLWTLSKEEFTVKVRGRAPQIGEENGVLMSPEFQVHHDGNFLGQISVLWCDRMLTRRGLRVLCPSFQNS